MEKSQTSLDIRNPGLRALPPGVERYFVRGGGLSVLEVLPEDKLEKINDEGKQTCEVVVFNSKGKSDLSILNLKENSEANFSKKTILSDEKITKLFKRKKFDLSKAKSKGVGSSIWIRLSSGPRQPLREGVTKSTTKMTCNLFIHTQVHFRVYKIK